MLPHIQRHSDELYLLEAHLQPQAPKRCGFRVLAAVGVSGLLVAVLLATQGFHPLEGFTRAVAGKYADEDDTACEVKFCSSFNVSLCPADRPLLVPNADLVKGDCAEDCCAKACSSFDVKTCLAKKPALVRDAAKVIGSSPFTCCAPYEVEIRGSVAVTLPAVCVPFLLLPNDPPTKLPPCCDPIVAAFINGDATPGILGRPNPSVTTVEALKAVLAAVRSQAQSPQDLDNFVANLLTKPSVLAAAQQQNALPRCLAEASKVLTGMAKPFPSISALFDLPDVRVNLDGTQPAILLTSSFAISAPSFFNLIGTLNFKDDLLNQLADAVGLFPEYPEATVAANIVDNVGTHFYGKLVPLFDVPVNCAPGPENLNLHCANAMQGPAVSLLFNTLGQDRAPAAVSVSIVDGTNPSAASKKLLAYDGDLSSISFHPTATEVISGTGLQCDNGKAQCEHWFLATVDPIQGAFLYYLYQDKLQLLGSKPEVKVFNLASFYSKPVVKFSRGVGAFVVADKSKSAFESLR